MLYEVSYCGFTDYFLAADPADAENKARTLSCGSSFTLRAIY